MLFKSIVNQRTKTYHKSSTCHYVTGELKISFMIFPENRLSADDSHEISCLICYF